MPDPRPLGRRTLITGAATAAVAAGALAGTMTPAGAAGAPGRQRRYAGKVVLITGATSGIGRAAALAFAAEGAKVGFCGRREHLGLQLQREIRAAGGEATYLRADVRRPAEVKTFVDRIARRYGGLDVAFNNAGIQEPWTTLEQTSVAGWDAHAETNTRGVFLSIKYQVPHMKAKGGVILVTGSANEFTTRYGLSAYSSSKSAVTGIVRTAAIELGQYGIRVVSLAPGTTETALVEAQRPPGITDQQWAAAKAEWGRVNVDGLRRMAKPEEMATAALALASGEMSFLTGTSVVVDGGMLSGTGGGEIPDL